MNFVAIGVFSGSDTEQTNPYRVVVNCKFEIWVNKFKTI